MAALLCAIAAAGAADAAAHGVAAAEHELTTVVDGSSGLPAGVRVTVATTPIGTQLVAENGTTEELEVLSPNGEPFIRIGPDGVLGNLRSPAWYRSNTPPKEVPDSALRLPERAAEGAAPVWARVSREPSWGWFDSALEPGSVPAGRSPDEPPHRFGSWTVKLRHGGRPAQLRGHFELVATGGAVSTRIVTPPALRGLDVRVLAGRRPALLVSVTGRQRMELLGVQGEPFLRIGPDGTEANEASPTWRSLSREASASAPTPAPRWRRVSGAARYAWTDPRASSVGVGAGERRRWSIPVVAGGERTAIAGETSVGPSPAGAGAARERRPGDGGPSLTLIALVVLGVVSLAAIGLLVRMHPSQGAAVLALLIVAALLVSGCGGGGDDAGAETQAEPAVAEAEPLAQWPLPSDPLRRATDAGLVPTRRETLQNHVHSHLSIFIDGRPVIVPAGIGIDIEADGVRTFLLEGGRVAYGGIRCADPCISPLHTHDDSGIVHTESRSPEPHRLGQVFTQWGVRLTPRCVGDFCAPEHPIEVYVDGRRYSDDPRGLTLEDRSVIAVVIGKRPAEIPTTADFSAAGG